MRRLQRKHLVESYDNNIPTQLKEGIIERITGPPEGPEFYIPFKTVRREPVESTKLRSVYDASVLSGRHYIPTRTDGTSHSFRKLNLVTESKSEVSISAIKVFQNGSQSAVFPLNFVILITFSAL